MTFTVYKVECEGFLPYYGSTSQKLSRRLGRHKTGRCACAEMFKSGRTVTITAIETGIPTKNIALWRERYYYRNFPNSNKQNPFNAPGDRKEWCKKYYHRSNRREYAKQWYRKKNNTAGRKSK